MISRRQRRRRQDHAADHRRRQRRRRPITAAPHPSGGRPPRYRSPPPSPRRTRVPGIVHVSCPIGYLLLVNPGDGLLRGVIVTRPAAAAPAGSHARRAACTAGHTGRPCRSPWRSRP